MFNRTLWGAALLLGMLAVGCSTFQPGQTIVKYDRGSPTRMSTAPEDGQYALYGANDLRNPEVRHQLKQGDKIGFTERDGVTYAVAGNNESPIQTSKVTRSYYWRKTK